MDPLFSDSEQLRRACRRGEHTGPTTGLAPGFEQANLVILPKEFAFDFLLFCQRNPRPCPLLDVTEAGDPEPKGVALGADLRSDLPKYRVWRDGQLAEECADVSRYWKNDFVSFLIGCSFTFEHALLEEGVPVRHIEQGRNVPMFNTNVECRPAGRFSGPLVVSMRPMLPMQALLAGKICERFPKSHGGPLHVGEPQTIGISDLNQPDYGDAVDVRTGELPVFWACGVTPQAALMRAKLPFAITHSPGHMFVTSLKAGS